MTEHPPGWHPDPRGRHEHRYWDGTKWTDHVADGGVTAQDEFDPKTVEVAAPIGPSMVNLPAIDPSLLKQISDQQAETASAPAPQPVSAPATPQPAPTASQPAPGLTQPAPSHRDQKGPEDALERASDFLDTTAASMAHKPLSLAALLTVAMPGFGHLYLGGEGSRRTKGFVLLVATIVAANVASWISWPIGLLIYVVALAVALFDLRGDLAPMQQQRTSGGPLAMFSDLGSGLAWRMAAVAGVLLVLSLVLPWYRISAGPFTASGNAFESFKLIDLVLLVIGAGCAALAILNVTQATSQRPVAGQMAVIVAAAAALALALVVFRLLISPVPGIGQFDVERSFGAHLAFIASVLLLGGAAGAATSKS